MLSKKQIDELAEEGVFLGNIYEITQAIETEVRKQDDALIQQLEEALTDVVEAGEEAWGKDRPCVRIGKEAINTARARLGGK